MKKHKAEKVHRETYNPDAPLTRIRISFASIDEALKGLQNIDWEGEPTRSSPEYSAKKLTEETRSILFGARGRMREVIDRLTRKS